MKKLLLIATILLAVFTYGQPENKFIGIQQGHTINTPNINEGGYFDNGTWVWDYRQKRMYTDSTDKRTDQFRIMTLDGTPLEDAAIKGHKNIWDYFLLEHLVKPYWPVWRNQVGERCAEFARENKDGWQNVKVHRKWIRYLYYYDEKGSRKGDTKTVWKVSGAGWKNKRTLKYAAWNAYYAFTSPLLQATPITKFKQSYSY